MYLVYSIIDDSSLTVTFLSAPPFANRCNKTLLPVETLLIRLATKANAGAQHPHFGNPAIWRSRGGEQISFTRVFVIRLRITPRVS